MQNSFKKLTTESNWFFNGRICSPLFLFEGTICFAGLESNPEPGGKLRWMIPMADPCKCTEVRLGGMYNPTLTRPFEVKYLDTSLQSSDSNEIKKWLNCPGKLTHQPFPV